MDLARTVIAAAALVSMAGSANAATEIVTNGSFESGVNPASFSNSMLWAGTDTADDIEGWTVTKNSVDYVRFLWEASEGQRSVDLAGSMPGVISQLLTGLIGGQVYSVTFDIAKNPDGGLVPRLGTSTVTDVSDPDTPTILGTKALAYSNPINSRTDMNWQRGVSYQFIALSQQALLSFAADGPSAMDPDRPEFGQAFGLVIDNVSVMEFGDVVAPVPEPATWALMILGFGIVGSALRRRRAAVRFNFA